MLSHFSSRRYVWQERALEEIYKNIWKNPLYKDLKNVNFNNDRIIVVCGIPQSGKTELVLQLAGISYEYSQKAYELSRGTRTRGKSSTSTAVCYHVSAGNYYALAEGDAAPVNYLEDKDFVQAIDMLRERVENGVQSINIVHIYFPEHFFTTHNSKIEVIDLPGIDTSDLAEKKHIEAIYAKYLPIATSILIVCRSNLVTQFEQSTLNDVLERYIPKWKIYSEKFILITTAAFSGSSYLQADLVSEKTYKQLLDDAENRSVSETMRHLQSTDLKIIPIDVGDSIRNPWNNNNIVKHGDDFVAAFRERCANNIELIITIAQKSINRAPLVVLTTISREIHSLNESYLEELNDLISSIDRKIDTLTESVSNDQEIITTYKEDLLEVEKAILENRTEIGNKKISIISQIDEMFSSLKNEFDSIKKNRGKIEENYIDKSKNVLLEFACCVNMCLSDNQISICPFSQTELTESVDALTDDGYSLFGRRKYVYKEVFNDKFIKYVEMLTTKKKEEICLFLTEKSSDDELENRRIAFQDLLQLREEEMLRRQNKLSLLSKEWKSADDDRNALNKLDSNVSDLMDYYYEICNQEYKRYLNEIIEEINADLSADIKLIDLFLLGLIEQDYNSIFENVGGYIGKNI